jgi:DNA-binding response OmpR family regulator
VSDPQSRSRTILFICSDIFNLYRRCGFLREHGWRVLSSTTGHGGIVQFAAELVDIVVLDVEGDGAETAVIAGELKRTKEKVPVIMLVGKSQTLVEGVVECADAVVPRLDAELLKALDERVGQPSYAGVL